MKGKEHAERLCNQCFSPLDPESRFCPECGAPAPRRVVGNCPNCGQPVMEGQSSCYGCGTRVEGLCLVPQTPPAKKKTARTGLWVGLMPVLLVAIMAVTVVLLFQPRNAESVKLARSRVSLLPGERIQLTYEVLPENTPDKSVTWHSGDTSVATVKNGEVVAVEAGTCEITVITANGMKDSCTVAVLDVAVQELSLSQPTLQLHVGETAALSCRILPENAETELLWSSDKESVASVDGGQITALALGSCTVTVTAQNGVSAVCTVTVSARAEEQLPVGTWSLTRVEDRFEETSRAAHGVLLSLTDTLTGILVQDGGETALTWCFAKLDMDGDYWYDISSTGDEDMQVVYSAKEDILTLYLADENWVFTRIK